jgi:hypothetical protein
MAKALMTKDALSDILSNNLDKNITVEKITETPEGELLFEFGGEIADLDWVSFQYDYEDLVSRRLIGRVLEKK